MAAQVHTASVNFSAKQMLDAIFAFLPSSVKVELSEYLLLGENRY